MSGISSQNKASAFAAMLKQTQQHYNPAAREQVGDVKNNPNSRFPVTLGNADRDDDEYRRRGALVDQKSGVVPGVGLAIAPEGYFDYVKRKEDENIYVNFQEWILKNCDFSTPESVQYWTDMFPFIRERMEAEIEREGELQKKLAKIAAVGPTQEEDWFTLYCLNQGLIKPYNTPLYRMNDDKAQPYQGGLFSIFNMAPFAAFKTKTGEMVVNTTNPIDGAWTGAANYKGISRGIDTQSVAQTPNVTQSSLESIYKKYLNPWG